MGFAFHGAGMRRQKGSSLRDIFFVSIENWSFGIDGGEKVMLKKQFNRKDATIYTERCILPGCVVKARNIQIFLHFHGLPSGRLTA